MKEVPDAVLYVLAVLAIGATLFGVIISFTQIRSPLITGASDAYVNISINSTIGITFVTDAVNFTNSNPLDDRESNDTNDLLPAAAASRLNFTNSGSETINVTISMTNMFTGTLNADTTQQCMQSNCNGRVNTACAPTGEYNFPTYGNCSNAEAAAGDIHIISNLSSIAGLNSAVIDFRVIVPSDEIGGTKSSEVTLTATSSNLNSV